MGDLRYLQAYYSRYQDTRIASTYSVVDFEA